ncbi:hypothetical protein HOD19_02175 [bacterium]|jgi:uncharacterized protein YdcH (DUF465 family)|nr:hypothetical protein [bacterium]MBT4648732.1 hypothetical protein [bacterium]
MPQQQEFDILKELGLDDLPEEKKQALREQIVDVIESRFNRALLNAMSEEDKKGFDKVLEKGEGVDEFIQAKVPNFVELHQEIIADLKQEMLKMNEEVFNNPPKAE